MAKPLAGDVRRRPVHRLEERVFVAQIRAGHEAQPAYEARAKVRDNISVKVLEQQHIELLGAHDELHATVVDDHLAVFDFRILLRDLSEAFEK